MKIRQTSVNNQKETVKFSVPGVQELLEHNNSLFEKAIRQTRFERDQRLRIDIEFGLLLMLLGIIFLIRISNITYNTLFVDEAINATIGDRILSGAFRQNATSWLFGSYLYPIMAAITSYFTGVVGLRVLSAIFGTITAIFIYLTTSRLFNRRSALWATLLFGLTGNAISLGQFATMDSLAIALFAIALYFLVSAILEPGRQETNFLLAAAISFGFSVLTKYVAILYLPALVLVGFTLYMFKGRSVDPLITRFLSPTIFILGAYLSYYLFDLISSFELSNRSGFEAIRTQVVIRALGLELGTSMVIILITTLVCIYHLPQSFFNRLRSQTRWTILLQVSLIPLVGLALLAGPLYHLATKNSHYLWTHSLYSLVFLASLAGHGSAAIVSRSRLRQRKWANYQRVIGATITIIGLVWYVDYGLDQNWGFQHSWPNVTGVVEYMRTQGLTKDEQILAEGAQIYEYYLDFGSENRKRWQNTWYMEYSGLQGIEAMKVAIRDHYFDYVILDDHYDPGIVQKLAGTLRTAGYTVGYEESQPLSIGKNVRIRVYITPKYFASAN